MEQISIALATIGATILIVGLFSDLLKRTPLQEPLIAVTVGIVIGPSMLGWLDVHQWPSQTAFIEQLAHLTLGIGLMAVALRISAEDLRRLWRPVTVLLIAGMSGMWAISSLSAAWALGLPVSAAVLLGAVLTPTDPIVASAIVTGRFAREHLPQHIRSSLSLESGANDGLAYLFIMLPILVLHPTSAESWLQWIVTTLIHGVGLAVVVGAATGYAAGRVLRWAHHAAVIETYSFLTFTTTLSLFTLGAASLMGANALLAVFVAGLLFTLSSDTGDRHEEERIQEAMSKLFTLPMFVVFGAAIPIETWLRHGWPLIVFVAAVILVRRLPVLALLLPALRATYSRRDVAYLGWFGPIGVAAIYYAAFAVERTGNPLIWEMASAVICASIVVHGLTAAPLSRLYSQKK